MGTGKLTISLRGGSSDRSEIELQPGVKAEAFSVGSQGSWRVSGPGISGVHAYLYFDGTTLFVCSAAGSVVTLGGAPVSTDWKPVRTPGQIVIGGVALDVRSGGAPAAPQPNSSPGRARPPPAPPSRSPRTLPTAVPAPKPAIGTRDYADVDDAPTQYQPMPSGFVGSAASPSSENLEDTRQRKIDSEPPEERTAVMQEPKDPRLEELREPSRPKAERPPLPATDGPGSFDGATVVKPLEQFLSEHTGSRSALFPSDNPDTAKRPLAPPTPAAGQPAQRGGGAIGVFISQPDPTRPAQDGMRWVGTPGAPDAQLVPAYPQEQGPYPQPGYGPQFPGQPQQAFPPQGPMQSGQYPGMHPGASGMMPMQPMQGMPPGMQGPGMQSGMQPFPPGMGGYDQQQPAWGMQQMPTQQPAAGNDLLSKWRALPGPRKLMYIMLPFGLVAFMIVFASPPPGEEQEVPPATDAGAAAGDAGTQGEAGSAVPPIAPTVAEAGVVIVPDAGAVVPPTADAAAAPPGSGEPVVAKPDTPAPPASSAKEEPPAKLPKGQTTQERKAADAVASGDYAKALEIYEQLAKEHPEQPAYARAAEILKRRVKK